MRGEDSRQGSCVGVLCRSGEWEAKQVNTQCQSECRSSDLSFFFASQRCSYKIFVC